VSALVAAAAALAGGAGLAWRSRGPRDVAPLLVRTVLGAVVVTFTWLTLLGLAGVPWSGPLMAVPALLVLAPLPGRRAPGRELARAGRVWMWLATGAVAVRVVLILSQPVFGWDFRYNWGLRARVLALAGGLDWQWLAWPGHAFARPAYPPLWPELIASGIVTGGSAATSATLWTAVLAVGLAAACAWAACPAPPPVRAIATVAGAWCPVILAPSLTSSGSAEPLVAFLWAAALACATRLRSRDHVPTLLILALVCLAMAKEEGLALAVALGMATLLAPARRRPLWPAAVPLLAALGAFGAWRFALAAHGLSGDGVLLLPARVFSRLLEMPAAVAAAGSTVAVLAVAWAAVLGAITRGAGRVIASAVAIWALVVLAAYLVSPYSLPWHVTNSLDRVLAAPLPGTLAVALGLAWQAEPAPLETLATASG
jgi:hypothetical protein